MMRHLAILLAIVLAACGGDSPTAPQPDRFDATGVWIEPDVTFRYDGGSMTGLMYLTLRAGGGGSWAYVSEPVSDAWLAENGRSDITWTLADSMLTVIVGPEPSAFTVELTPLGNAQLIGTIDGHYLSTDNRFAESVAFTRK